MKTMHEQRPSDYRHYPKTLLDLAIEQPQLLCDRAQLRIIEISNGQLRTIASGLSACLVTKSSAIWMAFSAAPFRI